MIITRRAFTTFLSLTGLAALAGFSPLRLITDAMRGDATLFTRNDEVEAQWRICDPIVQAWAADPGPLPLYEAGSQGPEEVGALLRRGDHWRAI